MTSERKLRARIERLERALKIVTTELDDTERKYRKLYSLCRHFSRDKALIIHLEDAVSARQAVIDRYQAHYAKWGHFYHDYEEKYGSIKEQP